jgi:hypothetical protein
MTGLVGHSGDVLDQASVSCEDGSLSEAVGQANGAQFFNVACPSGSVVTGLRGRVERYKRNDSVGALTLLCTDLNALQAGRNAPATPVVVFSGDETPGFEWSCPEGFAGVGLETRSGTYVDRVALLCTNVRGPVR